MSHAGTMDLGGNAQAKQNGSRWLAAALIVAIAGSAIGVIAVATRTGLGGGTATESGPYVNRYGLQSTNAVDRSYDQIEAQRGAITAPVTHAERRVTPSGSDRIEHLRRIGRNLVVPAPRDRVGGP